MHPSKIDTCDMWDRGLRRGSMSRREQVKRSAEEKWEIVQEGLRSANIAETCRKHGVAANLWYRWKDEAEEGAKGRRLRGEGQVRILAARPIGSSGGGVDHRDSTSLANRIAPVSFHRRPDCVKTAGSAMMGPLLCRLHGDRLFTRAQLGPEFECRNAAKENFACRKPQCPKR